MNPTKVEVRGLYPETTVVTIRLHHATKKRHGEQSGFLTCIKDMRGRIITSFLFAPSPHHTTGRTRLRPIVIPSTRPTWVAASIFTTETTFQHVVQLCEMQGKEIVTTHRIMIEAP